MAQSLTASGQIEATLKSHQVSGLSQADKEALNALISRNRSSTERPESCPLNSDGHKDILAKVESIRSLFKNTDCLEDPTQLDAILSGAQAIGQGIDNVQTSAGGTGSIIDGVQGTVPSTVNGQDLTKVVDGINTLFFRNKCALKEGTALERSADVVQNFSQLGLLVPSSNGLLVAGGGFALSSLLRLVSALFKKDFNFDVNSDRQNFIKLNCAFYDIRRQIELSGMVDVALPSHHRDLKESTDLTKSFEGKRKSNGEALNKIREGLQKARDLFLLERQGALVALEKVSKEAQGIVDARPSSDSVFLQETSKRETLAKLALLRESLIPGLVAYTEQGLSRIPLLDRELMKELSRIDPIANADEFMGLYKMEPAEFDASIRASLSFHFKRILADIAVAKANVVKEWEEGTLIEGIPAGKYIAELEKRTAVADQELLKAGQVLAPIAARLTRITGAHGPYGRSDDGTENKTAILANFDSIAEQVYGKWGHEFLSYTTTRSYEQRKEFERKFELFAKRHLNEVGDDFEVPSVDQRSELEVLFACQDAKPYRRTWAHADGLAQQGYDFVATNKELFHADIPRVFLGSTGGRAGIHSLRSKLEMIQEHHKSSLFARKFLTGQAIPAEAKERYLDSNWARRKKLLGTVMVGVEASRPHVQTLQRLIEQFDCNRLAVED
jgi:hypothetical protein